MTNSWDDMRKAKEESYFDRKNKEALARLKDKKSEKPRLSPVTGEPMEQVVMHGVVVDRCPVSGGVWLDAGELEQLMEAHDAEKAEGETSQGYLSSFFKGLVSSDK